MFESNGRLFGQHKFFVNQHRRIKFRRSESFGMYPIQIEFSGFAFLIRLSLSPKLLFQTNTSVSAGIFIKFFRDSLVTFVPDNESDFNFDKD
jgi:hypothetical protein